MKKRFLSVFLALALCVGLTVPAFAADTSGSCGDNVTWSYSNGTLTIQGTGPMDNCGGWVNGVELKQPWYDFYEEIHTVKIEDGVTSIGNHAFGVDAADTFLGKRSNLTSVTIPNSVTTIGYRAFERCSKLTSVTIPNSVTDIDDGVFYGCSSLTSVTIPDSVATIGLSAFATCNSLTSVTIPDSVTAIEVFAFAYCENLTDVTIPASVITIRSGAFDMCSSLTNVFYGGSESQWKLITIGEGNNALIDAAIHYAGTGTGTAFTDVPAEQWYAKAVNWAVSEDITSGTGNGKFSPGKECTHEQILTFLYRACRTSWQEKGVAASAADMEEAVEWAKVRGMIDDSFNGKRPCTRADAVSYIWQVFYKDDAESSGFTDVPAGADYAKAVDWTAANGIINGYANGDGTFSFRPDKICSRGEIVTFLHRAYVPEARLK